MIGQPAAPPTTDTAAAPPAGGPPVPYQVILGAFLAGKTREQILSAHPGLRSEDIEAAFDAAKRDYLAGILDGFEVDGVPLTTAEIATFQVADEVSQRFEWLVYQQKTAGLTPAERTEVNDLMRLTHVGMFAKVAAIKRLKAG
jgi:hypothetical protein